LDTWIAANLYLSDGRVIRFGHDEIESENIPADISFDTSNPGGFGSASVTLPRPEDLFADDGKLFSHLELYGPGNQVFYEGFVTGVPQVGDNQIQLNLRGWVSALDRHETFRQIFVDRDLGRWNSASRGRRITLNADRTVNDMSVETDNKSGYPALNLELTGPWAAHQWCEAVYDAGVNRVDSLYYDYVTVSAAASQPSSTFDLYLGFADDVEWLNQSLSADQHTVANSTGSGTLTSSSKQRCVVIGWRFNGSNTTDGYTYTAMFRNVAVFGNHGLTKRGTAPDQGYYASDIVGYAVQQCPSLTYSSDSIETTSFVIPHLTFTEDTSLRSVIEQVTALGGNQNVANDWGVYEDRTFYWRSPGTYGRTWHVRRDQVATSSSDGPDADRRIAGIKINYTDGAGTSLSVGPPGSNADYETTDLLDSDTDNPAYRIPGAYKSETIGIAPIKSGDTYSRLAVNAGVMILNERNRLDWRGSVSITGEAEDENGNLFPAALIRAGDRIVVSDSGDTTERTIVSTSYDHSSLTTTASIGATPDSLEALLGQLAAVTDLIGT